MKCVVDGCYNSHESRPEGVSLHKFPKDDEVRKIWLTAINQPNLILINNSVICSDHFEPGSRIRSCQGMVLRRDSVPCVTRNYSLAQINAALDKSNFESHAESVDMKTGLRSHARGTASGYCKNAKSSAPSKVDTSAVRNIPIMKPFASTELQRPHETLQIPMDIRDPYVGDTVAAENIPLKHDELSSIELKRPLEMLQMPVDIRHGYAVNMQAAVDIPLTNFDMSFTELQRPLENFEMEMDIRDPNMIDNLSSGAGSQWEDIGSNIHIGCCDQVNTLDTMDIPYAQFGTSFVELEKSVETLEMDVDIQNPYEGNTWANTVSPLECTECIMNAVVVDHSYFKARPKITNDIRRSESTQNVTDQLPTNSIENNSSMQEVFRVNGTVINSLDKAIAVIDRMKIEIHNLKKKIIRRDNIIKNLKRQKKRRDCRIKRNEGLLMTLKKRNLIDDSTKQYLEKINGPNKVIIERQLLQLRGQSKSKSYSPELKSFALNLNFLSPRAYEYIRKKFDNVLPHIRTIGRWYMNVGCSPGFTTESFSAIKKLVEASGDKIVVNVVFDEIFIRHHVEWDGKRSHGYVDFGDEGESGVIGTQILTFLAVCVNKSWKVPIAYFVISKITAEQKANLVKMSIRHLLDTGVEIIGVTFDGAATNLKMTQLLGCDVTSTESKGYVNFEDSDEKYILHPDPPHMIKLIRNALHKKGVFINGNGQKIEWKYFVALLELQEAEGLHLANKVRKAHINFEKQIMKVYLATQLFSESVAVAIDYCREVLQLEQFLGSEATSEFVRLMNNSFDILNSRRITEYEDKKRALCSGNQEVVQSFCRDAISYIGELKLESGQNITKSTIRVGFIGIIAALRNVDLLYERFISTGVLRFLPLYKINQDHIELFFSSIRTGLGYNDNPTVRQFTARYKKLLFRCQLRDGGLGNCIPLEEMTILNPQSRATHCAENPTLQMELDYSKPPSEDHERFYVEHSYATDPTVLSHFKQRVSQYIAGFVVRFLCKKIKCQPCIDALQGELDDHSLIKYKTRGLLKVPSTKVVLICEKVEKEIRRAQHFEEVTILNRRNFHSISSAVLVNFIGQDLFPDCPDHILIKLIVDCYLQTRYYFIAKKFSEKISKRQYRHKNTHVSGE